MAVQTNQILTVAQMRQAEDAIIALGTPVDELMQIAGTGAGEWCRRIAAGRSFTVLCGPGNNGGDGYVIAQYLRTHGLEVEVVAPLDPATDAAVKARSLFSGSVRKSPGHSAAILVDCLFGSGLTRALSPELLVMLQLLGRSHAYKIAIDLPSGIESDSGAALNHGLPTYDLTLALGAWKWAHWTMPASGRMGVRKMVPIGVKQVQGAADLIAKPKLKAPSGDAHKYRRGYLAIIGGEMAGASLLAAEAAMRSGAGYVKLLADQVPVAAPSDLVVTTAELAEALIDDRFDALLIGPGLGRSANAGKRLQQAMQRNCPTVIDADALVLLTPEMLAARTAPAIATPHAGELQALCHTFGVLPSLKRNMALGLARASGMVIVAKGPDSIIAGPDGRISAAPPATSWLSTAGTGDVLAGIAASRLAAGAGPHDAACEAVWLHGEAARLCDTPFTANGLAHCAGRAYAAAL